MGTGVAVWFRASLLIALFLGGMGATRMSMVWDRFTGLGPKKARALPFGLQGIRKLCVAKNRSEPGADWGWSLAPAVARSRPDWFV
jgi:hypothetical protein